MYEVRKPLFYSFLIFVLAIALGVLSALNDDTFVRLIMGDDYVNMTLKNIENGNPLAIYGDMNETDMFFKITFNNISCSFISFLFWNFTDMGIGQ